MLCVRMQKYSFAYIGIGYFIHHISYSNGDSLLCYVCSYTYVMHDAILCLQLCLKFNFFFFLCSWGIYQEEMFDSLLF